MARELCDAGAVDVNKVQAKASKEMKSGDEIEIRRRDRTTRVCVRSLPKSKQVPKSEASKLYEMLAESRTEDELFQDLGYGSFVD